MRMYKIITVLSGMLLLAACSDDPAPAVAPVKILATSGSIVDLTGTWKSACYGSGSTYQIDVHTYSGNTRTVSQEYYQTTDCSGTPSSTKVIAEVSGIVVGTATKTTTGWVDGQGNPTTAPASQAGPFMELTYTVSKHTGTYNGAPAYLVLIVDDSVPTKLAMYRDYDKANLDADGYPNTISTADPLFKK